jgi:hypothetical protein
MTIEERRRLVAALVGDQHRDQYLHDPEFHAAITRLAVVLPGWINTLAAHPKMSPTFTLDLEPVSLAAGPVDAVGIVGPHRRVGGR